tara:strand:- start:39 stop:617 length:579 start_codon:yes stop_codon:yes gene_type:complete
MATFKDKVQADAFKAGVQKNSTESLAWFRKKLRTMKTVQRNRLLRDEDYKLSTRTLPGRMYMYFYDPKHKKTLPYYDRFPLIIMVKRAPGGFIGLNLHYLPPILRARLFDALLDFKVGDGAQERIKITLGRLKAASKLRFYKPCYKHYLTRQIDSKMVQVPAAEWDYTLFLPSQQFKKASANKVWAESRKSI